MGAGKAAAFDPMGMDSGLPAMGGLPSIGGGNGRAGFGGLGGVFGR